MQSMMSSPDHALVFGRRFGENAIGQDVFDSMCKMRCRVFKERLGWEVPVDSGLECDEYDDEHAFYILIVRRDTREVEGGLRVRPTLKPYMLKDTFPVLMQGQAIPEREDTWEISRLALMNPKRAQHSPTAFADMTNELLGGLIDWAARKGCKQFVWVTSTAIERLMRRSLLGMVRISPVVRIGEVMCVADAMPVSHQAAEHCHALMRNTQALAA